jgi:hypothetical protein
MISAIDTVGYDFEITVIDLPVLLIMVRILLISLL